eukprot:Platyproteum_vivax@DN1638_c0_g1_i1.p1
MASSQAVYLHIYDLDAYTAAINKFVRSWNSGAYHAGIEVYGVEWSFGMTFDDSSGVSSNPPKCHTGHIYRESVFLGNTYRDPQSFQEMIQDLRSEWPGKSYNLFRRNCINFCDHMACLLGVGSIPPWLKSVPKKGGVLVDSIDNSIKKVQTTVKAIDAKLGVSHVTCFIQNWFGSLTSSCNVSDKGGSFDERMSDSTTDSTDLTKRTCDSFTDLLNESFREIESFCSLEDHSEYDAIVN